MTPTRLIITVAAYDSSKPNNIESNQSRIESYFSNVHPEPVSVKENGIEIFAIGSPIFREKTDILQVAKALLNSQNRTKFVRQLNGSFLFFVLDHSKGELNVYNDRFASIPLYYRSTPNSEFIASITYSDLWNKLSGQADFNRQDLNFFQLIHFQRLYGSSTYDSQTRFMNSASVLTYSLDSKSTTIEKYWEPEFQNSKPINRSDMANQLASTLKQSLARRMSDGKRYGLLLSGGLDSRLVLAASEQEMTCFTFADSYNNEVEVSENVARLKGYSHKFINRDPDHYSHILDEAVHLGSAMNVFDHAHALNLGSCITPDADIILHGHGIDPFFQGTYLPTERAKWLGKSTFIRKLLPIEKNMAAQYIGNIKHRLKSISSLEIVKKSQRASMNEYLVETIQEVMTEGKRYSDDPYDVWEYVYYQNMSRAFSNLNLLSIRTFAEERSVSYDNDLYDLYLRTPIKHRLAGTAHRDALSVLNPQLAKIPNANSNLPANWGPVQATARNFVYKALNKSKLNRNVPSAPNVADRSWPDRNDIFRQRPEIAALATALMSSEALASIDYIDMDRVRQIVSDHAENRGNYGDLLFGLITVDKFLTQN
jgi:asparagine synthase (glutamine-hydrolysing)